MTIGSYHITPQQLMGALALAASAWLAYPWLKERAAGLWKKNTSSASPDYRRGLDALEVLLDELRKAGADEKTISAWRKDAAMELLGGGK